jgi:hypothetical protein
MFWLDPISRMCLAPRPDGNEEQKRKETKQNETNKNVKKILLEYKFYSTKKL